jgi:hypothetical protein
MSMIPTMPVLASIRDGQRFLEKIMLKQNVKADL